MYLGTKIIQTGDGYESEVNLFRYHKDVAKEYGMGMSVLTRQFSEKGFYEKGMLKVERIKLPFNFADILAWLDSVENNEVDEDKLKLCSKVIIQRLEMLNQTSTKDLKTIEKLQFEIEMLNKKDK